MPIKLMLVSAFINRMAYPYGIPALSLTLNAALMVICYSLLEFDGNFALSFFDSEIGEI